MLASSCPQGFTCDQWGAWTCCMCSAAVPACVPTSSTGSITGPLRFAPQSGMAGQSITLYIEGAPFYIGAFGYSIRVDDEEKDDVGSTSTCTITATFTPQAPGIYPVEVSQYGWGTSPWVLAGFYTAKGGDEPLPTIQPGETCAANLAPGDPSCAQALPFTCACVDGRCRCKK